MIHLTSNSFKQAGVFFIRDFRNKLNDNKVKLDEMEQYS